MTSARPVASTPTIDDVAARSGMSRGTVSRYLNGGKNVSPTAARAIRLAIDETGFRVNPHARSLRSARSTTVALLLPTEPNRLFNDAVFVTTMRGVAAELSRVGLTFVLVLAGDAEERRRACDFVRDGHVGAVLICGLQPDRREIINELCALSVPVVAITSEFNDTEGVDVVCPDGPGGLELAVRYLASAGRRHIALLDGRPGSVDGNQELFGLQDRLGEEIDPNLVMHGDGTAETAAESTQRLLASGREVDAIVALDDASAAAAIVVLGEAGRRVADDVAVIGFGNDEILCDECFPTLTSVATDWQAMCEATVRILQARMTDQSVPRLTLVPMHLVRRNSA